MSTSEMVQPTQAVRDAAADRMLAGRQEISDAEATFIQDVREGRFDFLPLVQEMAIQGGASCSGA